MSNSELISLASVRLECNLSDSSVSDGSGFFFSFEKTATSASKIAIVTNKHVIEDSINVTLNLIPENNGNPDYQNHFTYTLAIQEKDWIIHPDNDVDLALLPFDDILTQIENDKGDIALFVYDKSQIPSTEQINDLRVIED
jgi:hypothetical protein